jgi:hypothetical protein
MSSRKRETLDQFTERAIRATDAGKLIPPIVYLPSRLRANNTRLTVDNVRITTDPPTIEENHIRIAEADPIGFLIALMHGQPIPAFEITQDGAIKVKYEIATFEQRERIAQWLGQKVTLRPREHNSREARDPEAWDEIVRKRNAATRAPE